MRVLFVQGAAERAGAERVLLALLRHLDRSVVDPVVAFLADGPFIDEVAECGIRTVRLESPGRLRNPIHAPRVVRDIEGAARDLGVDVVQATGEKMSVYTGWASRRADRIPCVFWLHDAPGHGPAAFAAQTAMAMSPRARVVTCSEWLAAAFSRRGVRGATPIPNGIELEHLPTPTETRGGRERTLAETCWPRDSIVFTHVGRLQRWKGTETFLRAGARVTAADDRARLLVVGGALFGREQAYAEQLPHLAAQLGLGDRIHFTGYRSDALELMGASDATVHCSVRPDPFPTVVLESMALGVPIVASRTRGPEEAIRHGHTGLLTDPGDDVGLAEAMLELARSRDLRRRLGETAAVHARRRFDARRMASDFESLWSTLVRSPLRRPRTHVGMADDAIA